MTARGDRAHTCPVCLYKRNEPTGFWRQERQCLPPNGQSFQKLQHRPLKLGVEGCTPNARKSSQQPPTCWDKEPQLARKRLRIGAAVMGTQAWRYLITLWMYWLREKGILSFSLPHTQQGQCLAELLSLPVGPCWGMHTAPITSFCHLSPTYYWLQ